MTRIRVELGPPAQHGDGGSWPADHVILQFAGEGELLKAVLVTAGSSEPVRELSPAGFERLVAEEDAMQVFVRTGTGTIEGPIQAELITNMYRAGSTSPADDGGLPKASIHSDVQVRRRRHNFDDASDWHWRMRGFIRTPNSPREQLELKQG